MFNHISHYLKALQPRYTRGTVLNTPHTAVPRDWFAVFLRPRFADGVRVCASRQLGQRRVVANTRPARGISQPSSCGVQPPGALCRAIALEQGDGDLIQTYRKPIMATTTTAGRTRAKIAPSIELDTILTVAEARAVYKALRILNAKLQHDDGTLFNSPSVAGPYFACKLGGLAAEAFAVAYQL